MRWKIIFFFLLFFPHTVFSLSIGASPDRINFDKVSESQTITILNPNDIPLDYDISYDEVIFSLDRSKGVINPDSQEKVSIILKSRNRSRSTISVYFYDKQGRYGIIPGITILAEIREMKSYETASPEIFKIRKLIDYNSMKGFSSQILRKIGEADISKKGLIIVFIEVLIGFMIYKKFIE